MLSFKRGRTAAMVLMGALVACFGAACGTKTPAPQADEPLGMGRPAPEGEGVFALEGPARQNFGGNVVFFADTITVEQVRRLLDASRRLRELNVDRVEDRSAWLRARERVAALEAESAAPPTAAKVTAWVSASLQEVAGAGEGVTGDDVTRDFAAYCEAKVLELATDPAFLARRYRARPSPFVACEAVYQERGLLAGDRCAPADGPEGRDYMACLWEDGVLKTSFAARFTQREGLARVLTDAPEAFRQWLLCTETGTPCAASKRLRFRQALMGLGALRVPNIPRGAAIGDVPLQDLFTDTDPEGAKPSRYVSSFQNTDRSDIMLSYLLAHKDVTEALALLAERHNGTPAEQDHFYHQAVEALPDVQHSTLPLAERRLAILSRFDPGLNERAAALAQARAVADAAGRRSSGDDPEGAEHAFLQEVKKAAVLANEPGMARSFQFSRLRLARVGAQVLVQVALEEGAFHYACLDGEGRKQDCTEDALAQREKGVASVPLSTASRDRVTGGLTLGWAVEDLALSGLAPKARQWDDPTSYAEFAPAELKGASVRFVIFPRPLRQGVGMATGEVFLETADGRRVGEGAASYFETTALENDPT